MLRFVDTWKESIIYICMFTPLQYIHIYSLLSLNQHIINVETLLIPDSFLTPLLKEKRMQRLYNHCLDLIYLGYINAVEALILYQ